MSSSTPATPGSDEESKSPTPLSPTSTTADERELLTQPATPHLLREWRLKYRKWKNKRQEVFSKICEAEGIALPLPEYMRITDKGNLEVCVEVTLPAWIFYYNRATYVSDEGGVSGGGEHKICRTIRPLDLPGRAPVGGGEGLTVPNEGDSQKDRGKNGRKQGNASSNSGPPSARAAIACAKEMYLEIKRDPLAFLKRQIASLQADVILELVERDTKTGPKQPVGSETFDDEGNKVVLLESGKKYELRVTNDCDQNFVVKGYKYIEGKRVPFLVGEGNCAGPRRRSMLNKVYNEREFNKQGGTSHKAVEDRRDDSAFKPLLAHSSKTFSGYQTSYLKEHFELTQEFYDFEVPAVLGGELDSSEHADTLYVDVFQNVGGLTFNRGGGYKNCGREKPSCSGALVPGEYRVIRNPCPGAQQRWESDEGSFLGTLRLHVKVRK